MNKPVILVIKSNMGEVGEYRTELLKKHVKYSDDFVETEDAIYYVRAMSVKIDMDKILLAPEGLEVSQYDITAWLAGMEKTLENIKKLAKFSNGVQSTPPPEFTKSDLPPQGSGSPALA